MQPYVQRDEAMSVELKGIVDYMSGIFFSPLRCIMGDEIREAGQVLEGVRAPRRSAGHDKIAVNFFKSSSYCAIGGIGMVAGFILVLNSLSSVISWKMDST